MIALRIRRGVTDHFALRFTEWVFTAIAACFAETLIGPGDTFDSSPSYAFMARLADENTWGLVIGAVALLRLSALVANGTFRPSRRWSPLVRSVCAGLSGGVWFCLAAGMCVSNVTATGWKTYGILMIADMTLSLMIARPAGAALETFRSAPDAGV